MELEEYIDSLVAQGLSQEEIKKLVDEFIANNNQPVEESVEFKQAYGEKPLELVKKQVGVPGADASTEQEDAPESDSLLGDGFVESVLSTTPESEVERRAKGFVKPNHYLINQGEKSHLDFYEGVDFGGATPEDYKYSEIKPWDNFSLLDKSKAKLKYKDLDINTPYYYFGDDESTFVEDNFGIDNLRTLQIDVKDFDGFIKEKGLYQDYIKKIETGFYSADPSDDPLNFDSAVQLENQNKLDVARERALRKMLNLYVQDKNKRSREKQALNYIFLNEDNLDDAELEKNAKIIENGNQNIIDPGKFGAYYDLQFPVSTAKDKQYQAARMDEVQNLESQGKVKAVAKGGLGFVKNFVSGFQNEVAGTVATISDALGFENAADEIRIQLEEDQLADASMSYARVEGKKIDLNGIEYIKNEDDGQIYNTTVGYNIGYTTSPLEYQYISSLLDNSEEVASDWDARGMALQAGQVTGGITFQIIGTKGLGGITSVAATRAAAYANGFKTVAEYNRMRELATAIGGTRVPNFRIPIKKSTIDLITFQSMYGATLGYEETLKQMRNAGISDATAYELASDAALQYSVLFGLTARLNPRTKATEAIFGRTGIQSQIKKAISSYKIEGQKGFLNTIKKGIENSVKKLPKTGLTFTEEGTKEVFQENVQQYGEYEIINENINQELGFDVLKDTYTTNDVKVTTALSFLTAGGIANVKIPNFKPDALNQIRTFYSIGSDLTLLQSNLDKMVLNGSITQEDAKKVFKDSKAVYTQLDKMPADIDASITLEAANALQNIQDLEVEKKNTDPAFHGPINERLNQARQDLSDIYINQDITKAQRAMEALGIKGETKAANTDNEFQGYLRTLVNSDGEQIYTEDQIKDINKLGVFVDSTGDILINKAAARRLGVTETGRHEFLHRLIYTTVKGKPELISKIGKDLDVYVTELIAKGDLKGGERFKIDLQGYKDRASAKLDRINEKRKKAKQFLDQGALTQDKYNEYIDNFNKVEAQTVANTFEETLTLLSESIASGDLVYEKDQDLFVKITDYIRNFLQSVGITNINLKDGKATFNFIRDYNKAFDKTEFNKAFKKLANTVSDSNIEDSVFVKESKKANEERNKKIDDLVGPKDTDGNYVMTKAEWDSGGIANAYMTIIGGTALDGLIRRGIEGNSVYGKPIETFIEDVKQGLTGTLMRFNPEENNSLMGWINGQMAARKGDVLNKYKKEQPLASKSLDVAAGEVGSVREAVAEETAEDFITTEERLAEQEASLKKGPSFLEALPVDQKVGDKSFKDEITEEVDKRIKRNIQFFDAATSANRTVKPFIAEIKKDLSDNFYKQTKKWFNSYEGGYEGFLRDFRVDLLNNYTTTYLSKHPIFRKGILKRVNGKWTAPKKVRSSYGGFKYDWVDDNGKKLKIDRDDAAGRGLTSGPEFIKRNPNITKLIGENEFIDYHFEDGALRKKRKQNPEKALAIQLASEIGLEILQNDLLTTDESGNVIGGPLTQAIAERAGLLEMVLADNAMITLASDIDRGNVKESIKKAEVKKIYEKSLDILAEKGENAFNEYIDGLSNQEAAQYVKRYFDDKYWQVGMYQSAKAKNRGLAYEKLVKRVLNASGNKEVKVSLIGKNPKIGGDVLLKFKNVDIPIELKLNDFAQMGSFTVKQQGDISSFTLKNINPEIKSLIENALKQRQPALDKYFEEAKKYADENGYAIQVENNMLRAPKPVFEYLRSKGLLEKTNITVKANQDVVNALYNNKGVYYMNIGNKGLFALGQDINNLGVPVLYSDIDLVIRLTRSYDSKYGRQATTRAFPVLTGNLIESAKSLDNAKEIKEVLENFQNSVKESTKEEKQKTEAANFSNDISLEFNKMIENISGIPASETISEARGKVLGRGKSGTWFIPYSHEDFVGLMYPLLGKGKLGEQQYEFIKNAIIRPYSEAEYKINQERLRTAEDFKALKVQIEEQLGASKNIFKKSPLSKLLNKKAWEGFKNEDAVRVFLWNIQGMAIPGLNESDIKNLVSAVNTNADLLKYAFGIKSLMKGMEYPAPKKGWESSNISYDIQQNLEKTRRKDYLKEWQENVDIAFSKENMAKLEAVYGPKYVEALNNILERMRTGRNRKSSNSRIENALLDYLNGSVSAIMALNTKSAVLQQLSNINFLNWTDNNPMAAAKAFANQKQYWRDVVDILNSDYLVNRRAGLKLNVTESELAAMAKSPNKIRAFIGLVGEKGFVLTKYGDSFAIATGGATFYRNRFNTYLNQTNSDGNKIYTEEEAAKKAMVDFIEISEDTQQSSRPDKISQQQAGNLGRLILAFANTPSQYARLTKKALLDLKNGRGSKRENIMKITYYGFVQNLIFSFMQQGLFSIFFGDDDENEVKTIKEAEAKAQENQQKAFKAANGAFDGFLRGLGVLGGLASTIKNMGIKLYEKSKRKRPDYASTAYELINVSPPIDSKLSKIRAGFAALDYDLEEIKKKGVTDITNPAYMAGARVIAGTTNVGVDRLFTKGRNIANAFDSELATWQRIFSLIGWQGYELGIEDEEDDDLQEFLNLNINLDLELPKIKL